MKVTPLLLTLLLFGTLITSCKKETENDTDPYQTERLTELYPLQPGKYIIYRLDSTVYPNFGRTEEIHPYQEKQVVDAQISDNLGRPTYRVYRYIRDTAGLKPWIPSGSYFVTPLPTEIEVSENNLRQIKLRTPVKADFTWKGNRYLAPEPYSSLYGFNNDNGMETWDFTYQQVGEPLTVNGRVLDHTTTVVEIDESTSNVPITDPKVYASKSLSVNKYAKGIGLVFQEVILWEYDVTTQSTPFRVGFGVKRSMIEHN